MNDENTSNITTTETKPTNFYSGKGPYARFIFAALGSLHWVGGLFAALSALHAEKQQEKSNKTLSRWVEEYKGKINELQQTFTNIIARIEKLGEEAKERIESEEYLTLVRKGFLIWDKAETKEKKSYVQCLLTNAASTKVTKDDTIRLFLDWIERYHEAHFGIIRAIYHNRGITRLGIWQKIGGSDDLPREDSSEADLFRMLIGDLSTGRIIRQERRVNSRGQFLKEKRSSSSGSDVMKSSFDNQERYELSELGQEFVHYVLQDAVSYLEDFK